MLAVIDHLGRTIRGDRRMLAIAAMFRSRRHCEQDVNEDAEDEQVAKGAGEMNAVLVLKKWRGIAVRNILPGSVNVRRGLFACMIFYVDKNKDCA